jgi:hypothetical protein
VLTIKKPRDKETSILGLLGGTAVALGAAAGEIWAITIALNDVSLGAADVIKWIAAVTATALLAGYGWTSVNGLLSQGTDPDPAHPDQLRARSALP